jgi:hypothetical protein
MPGRQELTPPVGPLNHQVSRTVVPLAPDHSDQLPRERMVWRRNPHPFDVTAIQVISLLVAVCGAPRRRA